MCTFLPDPCLQPAAWNNYGPQRGHQLLEACVRTFFTAPHHLPDVEEVQGWVSAQQGSKRRLSWAARGTWLAGRAGLTEQMLGSLGRADSEEPCRCLFPTADLPWLQREGSCFARHWNPCTPPPACLFILRLPA